MAPRWAHVGRRGLVHNAMGVVASARGDDHGGVVHLREALSIASEVGNPNDLATAYINLSHVLGAGPVASTRSST